MGISQSHLSAIMRPEDRRGCGLDVLLRLRALLQISMDDLLGLPPIKSAESPEEMRRQVRAALKQLVDEMRSEDGDDDDDDDPTAAPRP
jgi:hypothetical protein